MMEIDPIWAAEFRGLFWGEGNFMIDIMNRGKPRPTLVFSARCRCRVIARDDNRPMLEDFQRVLGGHIYTHKSFKSHWIEGKVYTHNRNFVWQVQSVDGVEQVIDILENGLIPALKAREIPVMREAITIMRSRRYRYTDDQRQQLRDVQQRLFALRQYSGC